MIFFLDIDFSYLLIHINKPKVTLFSLKAGAQQIACFYMLLVDVDVKMPKESTEIEMFLNAML
jgi:hypothetical protein